MVHAIIDFSLKQRPFVIIATGALVVLGAWAAWRLPIDAVPDITNVQVQINTEVPALSPEEIESQVTFPLETEMSGVPELVELRSLSKFGLSQITLVFREGADIYRARQLVSERIQNAVESLPAGLLPKLAPITTGLGEIYYYVVDYRADAADKPATRYEQLLELKQVQDWIIKPLLRTVPGIAEVNTSGGYDKQFVVMPNPERMMAVGLSFSELAEVIEENVENAGGGAIQRAGEQVTIRVAGRVQTVEDLASLPIRYRTGATPLFVRDVAEVAIGSSVRTGASTVNGDEAVVGAALMFSGENSRLVARRVHDRLREIGAKLPAGVEVRTLYNRSDLVNRTIRTVEKNLLEGAFLVVAVLLLLVGNVRGALIVASAIPLSMLFAMIGMVQGRVSGNLMSLGAIDFGLIVDGAVVMTENVLRQLGLRQHALGRPLNDAERTETVRAACRQVGSPMVFAVAIITVVYVPILALTGIEGKMFKPMAITVMLALVGALALALTLVPVLCSFFLKGRVAEKENALMRLLQSGYRPTLRLALRAGWLPLLLAVGLFAWSLRVFAGLGAEFVPQLDEGSFATHMIRTTSIGLDASTDMQKRAERVLLEHFPEVDLTFSRIGTAEVATDPMGVNVSDTYMFFAPPEAWRKEDGARISKDRLADLMSEELTRHVPGQAYLFSQPIEMRFNEILEGTRADLAVKVFGDDFAVIERVATEVRDVLETIPGAADVEFDALGKAPVLEIKANRSAMAKYAVHAGEINGVVESSLGGHDVGSMAEGNRRFDVVVRMAEPHRRDVAAYPRLPLRTDSGGLIALGAVADIVVDEKVAAITRESGQRRAAILVNLRGRDVESFVKEAQAAIASRVQVPQGYFIEFGGQFKNLQEARRRLMVVVPAALALIFLLIFAAFKSVHQAVLIYTGIPLAVTGGIFALGLRGMPFSISAGIGFIALSGVAVLNGVVMISYFNLLREQGRRVFDAVWEGAQTRLRPVLMTALVASLGFVPMALASGAGAEVQRPLATVVIGGILTSTFLTLVLLPALYLWVEGRAERRAAAEDIEAGI
jgi:cobalt-zinc-cadmium resistance protein CzcA